jgi:hypothetical protein
MLLFIGEKDGNGKIKGERYTRRLVENTEGIVLKTIRTIKVSHR